MRYFKFLDKDSSTEPNESHDNNVLVIVILILIVIIIIMTVIIIAYLFYKWNQYRRKISK